jgi:hypothetical protein
VSLSNVRDRQLLIAVTGARGAVQIVARKAKSPKPAVAA